MVSSKKALITSLISAAVISAIYWIIQSLMNIVPIWIVFLLVFLLAYGGMRGWKI